MQKKCSSCACFFPLSEKTTESETIIYTSGECRFFPPTKTVQPIQDERGRWGQQLVSSFPSTHEELWCQQFIRRNNAVKT